MEKMSNLEKIKDFCLKYNKLIFATIITGLLFFANLFSPLWIVATVLTLVFYAFLNVGEIVVFSMYFNMFSGIETFYIASLLCGLAVIITKYVIDIVRKKAKFYVLPLVLTFLYIVVFSLINYGYDSNGALQGALIISLLIVSYLLFVYRKQISVDEGFKALMLGILVSTVLALVSMLIPEFAHKIYHYDGTYKRLKLFCLHQNHLAVISLFAMSYYVYKLVNKKGKVWVNILFIILLFVLGLFTLSKAFIVVAAIIILYAFICMIAIYKKKSLKVVIPCLIIMVAACFIAKDLVLKIINRFVAYNTTSSFISQITTGRSGIWYRYFAEISSSVQELMFGVGLFSKELVKIGPHNVLVYFLYRSGIVGIILLAMIVWSYLRTYDGKCSITLKNCLPILTFIIIAMEEMVFSDRFYFFMVLAIMLIFKPKETNEDVPQEDTQTKKLINKKQDGKIWFNKSKRVFKKI